MDVKFVTKSVSLYEDRGPVHVLRDMLILQFLEIVVLQEVVLLFQVTM